MAIAMQGSFLRERREAMRRSQRWLAEASGVSERTIIRAEGGARVSSETLLALCSVLKIDAACVPDDRKAIKAGSPTRVATIAHRIRIGMHACIAASVVIAGVWAMDTVVNSRVIDYRGGYLDRLQEGWIVALGSDLATIADLEDPTMRARAMSDMQRNVAGYPECPGTMQDVPIERRWGDERCHVVGSVVPVVDDGTLALTAGPLTRRIAMGTMSMLASDATSGTVFKAVDPSGVSSPWFDPATSRTQALPPFVDGGFLVVRVQPKGDRP